MSLIDGNQTMATQLYMAMVFMSLMLSKPQPKGKRCCTSYCENHRIFSRSLSGKPRLDPDKYDRNNLQT